MIKKIRELLQAIIIVSILVVWSLAYIGYRDYEELMIEKPLDVMVYDIISDDDFVPFDEITQMSKDATIVTEDDRLYERNSPLDFKAIGRASLRNIKNMKLLEGGSTIPQQVAKNMYFDHSASVQRKVAEYFIAKDLLEEYGTDEILSLYLNIIYFGDGHYGIGEASWGYFNKPARELSDYEATLLAGLPQAPSIYHLSGNYEGARERQEHVLSRLVDKKIISVEEATEIYNMGGSYEEEND